MTPAEISSLALPSGLQSSDDGSDGDDSEDDLPLLSRLNNLKKFRAAPAVQQPGQAACPAAHGPQEAMPEPEQLRPPTAALSEAAAACEADEGAAEVKSSKTRGSRDAILRHIRDARHGERAECSRQSSDSKQQEAAKAGVLTDTKVGTHLGTPRQHGQESCSTAGMECLP